MCVPIRLRLQFRTPQDGNDLPFYFAGRDGSVVTAVPCALPEVSQDEDLSVSEGEGIRHIFSLIGIRVVENIVFHDDAVVDVQFAISGDLHRVTLMSDDSANPLFSVCFVDDDILTVVIALQPVVEHQVSRIDARKHVSVFDRGDAETYAEHEPQEQNQNDEPEEGFYLFLISPPSSLLRGEFPHRRRLLPCRLPGGSGDCLLCFLRLFSGLSPNHGLLSFCVSDRIRRMSPPESLPLPEESSRNHCRRKVPSVG